MKKNNKGFSIVEIIISVIILSIFLIGAYKGIDSFYNTIHYIDSNLNGLNITKTGIDEIINLRNEYLNDYSFNGWEQFASNYSSGTFKIISNGDNTIYLSGIVDKRENYEGPLNILGKKTNNLKSIYFLRKVDINEENKFYLKNIDRTKTLTGEILKLKFTDKIYNNKSFLISGEFENTDLKVESSLDTDYYDLNGNSGIGNFSNLNNPNLRYSKIISYGSALIQDGDYIAITYSGLTLLKKIIFYDINPPVLLLPEEIPLKIDSNLDKNYYNICNEIKKTGILDCEFNYFIKDNFYQKLIGIDRELSNIDFGDDFNFSFSGANNNEIWIYLSSGILPIKDDFLFLNPFYEVKNNTNTNNFDYLSLISDATSGRGLLIPEKPNVVGNSNTSTGYTSLLNVKITTLLYDNNKFINKYEINTKIGDINRYQNKYEK